MSQKVSLPSSLPAPTRCDVGENTACAKLEPTTKPGRLLIIECLMRIRSLFVWLLVIGCLVNYFYCVYLFCSGSVMRERVIALTCCIMNRKMIIEKLKSRRERTAIFDIKNKLFMRKRVKEKDIL